MIRLRSSSPPLPNKTCRSITHFRNNYITQFTFSTPKVKLIVKTNVLERTTLLFKLLEVMPYLQKLVNIPKQRQVIHDQSSILKNQFNVENTLHIEVIPEIVLEVGLLREVIVLTTILTEVALALAHVLVLVLALAAILAPARIILTVPGQLARW